MPRLSTISRRRLSATPMSGSAWPPRSAATDRVFVYEIVTDRQLAIDEVPVVVGEEPGDRDVVSGEGSDGLEVIPDRDDLEIGGIRLSVEMSEYQDSAI